MKLTKVIILLAIVLVLVIGCSGQTVEYEGQPDKDAPNGLIYLGRAEDNYIYRFNDGDTVCYVVDGYQSTSIDCLE